MTSLIKTELILEGLDCACCASKIEDKASRIAGVASACINFSTKTLSIETQNSEDVDRVLLDTTILIKNIDSHIIVTEKFGLMSVQKDIRGLDLNKITRFGVGAVLFLLALTLKLPIWVEVSIYLLSYILVGGVIVVSAFKNILRGQVFDENFLMSVATIGAFAIGEFSEGVAVMIFYQVGEFFQQMAVNRSRKSIAALMDIRPDFANIKIGDEITKVSPNDVHVGDMIVVKPGEKVPLDGIVMDGNSMLDTSALTGESVPREIEVGNEVLSGSINQNGLLTMRVTKIFGDSTVSKILELVQNASNRKAPTETFITKFARYYTPTVVIIAIALAIIPPLLISGADFFDWINRALIFLVVSCPCALMVSIPLGLFGGIGGASKNGVLIKGSNYLEALNYVDTIVFDKTGTLTKGVFKVTKINDLGSVAGIGLLEYAAYAESFSNHPIALSIVKAYGKEIDKSRITDFEEVAGNGIKAKIFPLYDKDIIDDNIQNIACGQELLLGNANFLIKEKIIFEQIEEIGTIIHIAIDKKYLGCIVISDELKDDSLRAINELRKIGIKKLIMLTGDCKSVANKIAKQLNLDEVYSELLPEQKVQMLELFEKQKSPKSKIAFVGDGINDAPVLALADVGVAMGGVGSDAAIEAADVVLMTDEPSKLVSAIKIAKRTRNIVFQNIVFALGVKAIVLILGACGIATMWEAVFADVGVSLIAILNAIRVIKVDNR